MYGLLFLPDFSDFGFGLLYEEYDPSNVAGVGIAFSGRLEHAFRYKPSKAERNDRRRSRSIITSAGNHQSNLDTDQSADKINITPGPEYGVRSTEYTRANAIRKRHARTLRGGLHRGPTENGHRVAMAGDHGLRSYGQRLSPEVGALIHRSFLSNRKEDR